MKKNQKIAGKQTNRTFNKTKALEQESNITLISTSVAILSFFVLLYVHSAITTNFIAAQTTLNFIEVFLLVGAIVTAGIAIWKKKYFLFEYTAFCLVMAIGYYFLENGASGIPFLFTEKNGTFTVSPIAMKLSAILRTNYIIYGLWAVNVLYCILTIVLHTVKYTKIKNAGKQA